MVIKSDKFPKISGRKRSELNQDGFGQNKEDQQGVKASRYSKDMLR
jgi:hypothetical protein